MADKSLTIRVNVTGTAPADFRRISDAAKEAASRVQSASGASFGPSRASFEESAIARAMESRTIAMERAADSARLSAEASRRMFGEPEVTQGFPPEWSAKKVSIPPSFRLRKRPDEDETGIFRSLNLSARTSETGNLLRLMNVGGALYGVQLAQEGLKNAAKSIDDYYSAVKRGIPQQDALKESILTSIPVVGSLASSIGDFIQAAKEAVNGTAQHHAREDEGQDERDMRQKTYENRERIRGNIIGTNREAWINARDESSLNGLRGSDLEMAEAALEASRSNRQIDKDAGGRGALSSSQQVVFDKQIAERRGAVQQKYFKDTQEIINKGNEATGQAWQASNDKVDSDNAQSIQYRLQMQGNFHAAELEQTKRAGQLEINEAHRRYVMETTGQNEHSALAIQALDRFTQEKISINNKTNDQIAQQNQQNAYLLSDQKFSHRQQMNQIAASAQAEALQAEGKSFAARQTTIDAQYRKEQDDAKEHYAMMMRDHKENSDEWTKELRESLGGARAEHNVASLVNRLDALKSAGPVNMSAQSLGGVGYSADALSALAQPLINRESAMSHMAKEIAGIKELLTKLINGGMKGTLKVTP